VQDGIGTDLHRREAVNRTAEVRGNLALVAAQVDSPHDVWGLAKGLSDAGEGK